MNLRDLSELLGLSQTTVSRALNGYPEVSEKTRERVSEAARLHGYRPSAAAQRLATGQSGTLGVVFPHERNMLADLLFTEFLGGCVERASDLGYDVTLAMAKGSQTEEAVYRRAVRQARVDGMILSSPLVDDARPALLRELGVPFILHGRTRMRDDVSLLDIDNEGAFFQATKLLCDLGHRRIGLINGEERFNFAHDRRSGFQQALLQSSLPCHSELMASGPMLEQQGADAARRMLKLPRELRPTALICSSIAQAQGVRRVCQAMDLKIGTDISVIAHDDRIADLKAESFDPPLTATQSSIGKAGQRIVELLVEQLRRSDAATVREVWPVDLVLRSSTGPAPMDS